MDLELAAVMRFLVRILKGPTIATLLACAALAVVELGLLVGERLRGLRALRAERDAERAGRLAQRRIERADLLARVGPMLGLMGTLIPLGPGLAALGQGDVRQLADAVTVAFDTTVLGLLIGIVGFALGRVRRRVYDRLLDELEAPA